MSKSFVRSGVVALLPLLLAGCGLGKNNNKSAAPDKKDPAAIATPEAAPGEILVRYKPSVPGAKRASSNAAINATLVREFKSVPGLQHLRIPGADVKDALAALRNDPD